MRAVPAVPTETVKSLGLRWKSLLEAHQAEFMRQLAHRLNGERPSINLIGLSDQIEDVMRAATAAGAASPSDAATLVRMGLIAHGIDLEDTEDPGTAAIVAGLTALERWVPALMAASISIGTVCQISRSALTLTFLA